MYQTSFADTLEQFKALSLIPCIRGKNIKILTKSWIIHIVIEIGNRT